MVIVSLSPRQWAHELTARYIDTNETTIVIVRDFEVLRERILELLNQIRVQFQVFPPKPNFPHICYLTPDLVTALIENPDNPLIWNTSGLSIYDHYHNVQRQMISDYFKVSTRKVDNILLAGVDSTDLIPSNPLVYRLKD